MRRTRRRPITLSDGMILVAASGIGLGVYRWVLVALLDDRLNLAAMLVPPPMGWTPGFVLIRAVQWLTPALPFAAAWTVTVPILRVRAPRPPLRRCLRQPGMVACLGAIFGVAWAVSALAGTWIVDRVTTRGFDRNPSAWFVHLVVEEMFPCVGLATAAAIAANRLGGRGPRPADWVDRLGRILGWFWVVSGLVWSCRRYLRVVDF